VFTINHLFHRYSRIMRRKPKKSYPSRFAALLAALSLEKSVSLLQANLGQIRTEIDV
jgi:hypothetical protein